MSILLDFWVRGIPQTQGSVRAILPRGSKHPVVIHDRSKELAQWRAAVSQMAAGAMLGQGRRALFEGPVRVELTFLLQSPAAARSELRTARQRWHWGSPWRRPDLDKLQRSVLDALTGTVFSDDGQVVQLRAEKTYGQPGVHIVVEQLEMPPVALEQIAQAARRTR